MFEYICNGAVAKWSKAEASKASFVGSNPAGASKEILTFNQDFFNAPLVITVMRRRLIIYNLPIFLLPNLLYLFMLYLVPVAVVR